MNDNNGYFSPVISALCFHNVRALDFDKISYGPRREKTCLRGVANNKGPDQPARLRSLISAFVIRLLESIISRFATSKLSSFKVVSVAEETDLNLDVSKTPKTGFVAPRPICYLIFLLEKVRKMVPLILINL